MIWTKMKRHAIKSLLDDKRFDVVLEFMEDRLAEWRKESGIGMDEFNTLKNTFMREGKINGITNFFELLEKQALGGDDD